MGKKLLEPKEGDRKIGVCEEWPKWGKAVKGGGKETQRRWVGAGESGTNKCVCFKRGVYSN